MTPRTFLETQGTSDPQTPGTHSEQSDNLDDGCSFESIDIENGYYNPNPHPKATTLSLRTNIEKNIGIHREKILWTAFFIFYFIPGVAFTSYNILGNLSYISSTDELENTGCLPLIIKIITQICTGISNLTTKVNNTLNTWNQELNSKQLDFLYAIERAIRQIRQSNEPVNDSLYVNVYVDPLVWRNLTLENDDLFKEQLHILDMKARDRKCDANIKNKGLRIITSIEQLNETLISPAPSFKDEEDNETSCFNYEPLEQFNMLPLHPNNYYYNTFDQEEEQKEPFLPARSEENFRGSEDDQNTSDATRKLIITYGAEERKLKSLRDKGYSPLELHYFENNFMSWLFYLLPKPTACFDNPDNKLRIKILNYIPSLFLVITLGYMPWVCSMIKAYSSIQNSIGATPNSSISVKFWVYFLTAIIGILKSNINWRLKSLKTIDGFIDDLHLISQGKWREVLGDSNEHAGAFILAVVFALATGMYYYCDNNFFSTTLQDDLIPAPMIGFLGFCNGLLGAATQGTSSYNIMKKIKWDPNMPTCFGAGGFNWGQKNKSQTEVDVPAWLNTIVWATTIVDNLVWGFNAFSAISSYEPMHEWGMPVGMTVGIMLATSMVAFLFISTKEEIINFSVSTMKKVYSNIKCCNQESRSNNFDIECGSIDSSLTFST
ncbi:MAG: hypothetical protein ACE365_01885 [Gammaproteobacteria bacterium]